MNENPKFNSSSRGAVPSAAMGFVLGAVVGAGIALLLAPRAGRETRRHLATAGRRLGDTARSKLDQARNAANDLKHDAKSALEAGREAFGQGQRSHESAPTPRTELKG